MNNRYINYGYKKESKFISVNEMNNKIIKTRKYMIELMCIKKDSIAEVICGKDKGELHGVRSPELNQRVQGEFTSTGMLRIKGYDKDHEGNSIYHDHKCFATIEEYKAMLQIEIKEPELV